MRFLYFILALLTASPSYAAVIPSIPYNLTNGSLADATQVMGNFNTIVTDVNANTATSGANSNITSLTGLTTPLLPSEGGTVLYTGGTSGGSGNAQTLVTTVPVGFGLVAGNYVTGIAGFSNSGATTLTVGATSATAMRKQSASGLTALVGGEIIAGQYYTWLYDGTYYQLLNPTGLAAGTLAVGGGGTGQTSLTSNSLVVGNGTAAVGFIAPSSSGNVLTSNGTIWASSALPVGSSSAQGIVQVDGTTITASGGTISSNILMTPLGVGSIIFAGKNSGAPIVAGETDAGSGLTPYFWNINGFSASGDSMTGTWRALGSTNGVGNTDDLVIFQRISKLGGCDDGAKYA